MSSFGLIKSQILGSGFYGERNPMYTVFGKKDRQYFGRNIDKFRQLLVSFGKNHPNSTCDWKIVKCPINTCTIRNDDVIKNVIFAWRETPECILPLLRPPDSPDLNPADYSVWGILQDVVYKRYMTDLDDLKHRIRTEWAKLDHAVIAAFVHQWRCRLSGCVKAGGGHFENCFWFRHCVFSDNYDLSCCRWRVEQLHASGPVWFNCSYQLSLCALQ